MDLNIIRGDDEFIDLQLATASGTAADLTNVDLWFTVKENQFDKDDRAVLQKSTIAGTVVIGSPPEAGLAVVSISSASTATLRARFLSVPLYWDVQLKDGAGNIQTVASGTITIAPDITRSTS